MLCMLPWLAYSQNEQTPQEQLVSLMKNYYHSDINNIQALLDAGASFDVKDEYGRTPIFYLRAPEFDLAELLEVYPIDLTVSDNDGYTVYEYLLKNTGVLGVYSGYDSKDCLKFMNLMKKQHAPYDTKKFLFTEKDYSKKQGKYGNSHWRNKYIGKTIPQIRRIVKILYFFWYGPLEALEDFWDWITDLDTWIVIAKVILGLLFYFVILKRIKSAQRFMKDVREYIEKDKQSKS
jgi:hypothetical protein